MTTSSSSDHFIIGIGASAGGLEPIHEFFDNMPDNTNFSFVVVQHLSPDHKSLMGELLAKHTRMQIKEAEEDMVLEKNCVYLIPSKKVMTLSRNTLKLHDKERYQVPNNAIDTFFESLAREKGKNAVGVILSGTGTDGTKGIEAIKKQGGLAIVQDPITADFDGMPNSAIATGLVDLILSPEMIAEELVEYLRDAPYLKNLERFSKDDEAVITDILQLVKNNTGHDFSLYKKPTINRRLAKNLAEKGFEKLTDYYSYLKEYPEEAANLGREFLINVTKFFRDPEAFEEIKSKVIPAIFANKKPHDVIKIWVVACSSGEEPYSLAMLLHEYMDNIRSHDYNIKIFATDIDKEALQQASLGTYPESIAKDLTPERLSKFFIREGNSYRIIPSLRKMVVFAYHDIIKDPPFSKLDLVSCRNMLIYMNVKLQRHVLKSFLFALNHGAFLLLGASENVSVLKDSMKEISKKWKIYKCTGKSRVMDAESLTTPVHGSSLAHFTGANKPKNAINNLAEIFKETLMDEYRYAGILIDENMEVKHAIGHFKEYLNFPENNLTFNLLKLVSGDLAIALGICIRKAIQEQEKNVIRNIKLQNDKVEKTVNIIVKPYLQQQDYQQSFIFVIIQEEEEKRVRIKRSSAKSKNLVDTKRLEELERELRETKENLQSVIEELESSNEELLTSNEEMISANEELQSTNEELQSLNEELHTVSAEHQLKIKELIELNDDLNNYFNNSEIGQILVDKHLIVRRFSPAVTSQINLIETDIGRPINDITNNINDIDLISEIRKVIITNEVQKKEISIKDGRSFLMKITPYVRQDRTIDGVVVNFIDVSEIKNLSSIIEGVFNGSKSGISAKRAIRNEKGTIIDFEYITANKSAKKIIGKDDLEGKKTSEIQTSLNDYLDKYVKVVETGKDEYFEFYSDTTQCWYEVSAVKMRDGVVTTITDVTQKKKAADLIAQSYKDLKNTSSKLQETNYKLEQSNLDLLQFASVASHDLKEPLRKIQTFGNLLYSKVENKLETNEKNYLDKIVNASNRMQVLIEDVLTLSKLSNTDIPYSSVDLKSVIQHIIDDLEISIREKGTVIHIGNLPRIDAVPGQMHQLFQNLISNALKFNNKTTPMVKIETRDLNPNEATEHDIDPVSYVVICVEDNGIGFEEKYKEKIFGIFQRLHSNNQYQGTGIGLAICKKIVDNHHGFIKAESEPGKGARFLIILPKRQTA
ncbi:chemotaxis protein CheB [Chryseosolibacter indicus]|uniref:PAS domain-containing protein n=1 Tax=Chryseosolibacter indicus TaxID=2782351 RepID=A0ABS5VLS0_9BACT|nr:chemotaxis protein CheB [Chryseosolibacter indicus]MBT1702400.1 PAS domain-containing protein [Chryseosolibacter indicus]